MPPASLGPHAHILLELCACVCVLINSAFTVAHVHCTSILKKYTLNFFSLVFMHYWIIYIYFVLAYIFLRTISFGGLGLEWNSSLKILQTSNICFFTREKLNKFELILTIATYAGQGYLILNKFERKLTGFWLKALSSARYSCEVDTRTEA